MNDLTQCATCGVERGPAADDARTRGACPICADERQYLPVDGQHWLRPGQSPSAGSRSATSSLGSGS